MKVWGSIIKLIEDKKAILLACLVLMLSFTTGCIKYGKGETVGYVYAVDDGVLWDKVWYKSSLESSESDCYLIDDSNLKNQLRELSGTDTKVKLKYDRHLFTASMCPEGAGTDDEITSIEIMSE